MGRNRCSLETLSGGRRCWNGPRRRCGRCLRGWPHHRSTAARCWTAHSAADSARCNAAGSAHCSQARCSVGCCPSTGCCGIPSSVRRTAASRSKTMTAACSTARPARRSGSSPRNSRLRWPGPLRPPGRRTGSSRPATPCRERLWPPAENERMWCCRCSSARTTPHGWRTAWQLLPQPVEQPHGSFPPTQTAPPSAARCWNLDRSGSHAPKAPSRHL